ncbi:transmembrane amino acid transporter protein [Ditylenchus destructor]|nr:transmembrane amino acid transporter protein [Ditylenchus destructor]
MVGPGTLFVPLAFKQGGLIALPIVFIFGFLNTHCMLKIVHCSQYFSKNHGDNPMDYGRVAHEACLQGFPFARRFRHWARYAVNTAVFSLQMGICSISFVFMAQHLQEFTEENTSIRIPEKLWILILLPAVVLLNFIRTLKVIAVLSAIGYVFMIGSLIFIFQYLLRAEHILSQLPWITNFDGLMTCCGSVLYAFEGQAMVLPMENKLKDPRKMIGTFGVLSVGMSIVTTVYAGTGFVGYATYGESIKGSITLSLPPQPLYTSVKLMLTAVIFFGFVLQQYVMVDMIWPELHRRLVQRHVPRSYLLPLELTFRAMLVIIAMLIAVAVPNLGQIISLIGITSGNFLAFIFPSIIDTLTFGSILFEEEEKGIKSKTKWRTYMKLAENGFLLFVGIFGLIAGLKANINSFF